MKDKYRGFCKCILIFLIFTCIHCKKEYQYEFYSFYKDNVNKESSHFLNKYPIPDYLKKYSVQDISLLDEHRKFLEEKKHIGDAFLCQVLGFFVDNQTESLSPFKCVSLFLPLGEKYLAQHLELVNRDKEIFHVIGYFLLGKTAQLLEKNESDFSEEEYNQFRQRLARHKIFLTVKESWWTKTKKSTFRHVVGRLMDSFRSDEQNTLSLYPFLECTPASNAIRIFSMYEKNKYMGSAIWMSRKEVCCKYLASKNIISQFKEVSATNKMILVASGGFTNDLRQPEGLTIQNGEIINAVLKPENHALVIVEQGGGIRICNLKKHFLLPSEKDSINPLYSLSDYIRLINWCRTHKSTVFQTQLLAYGNNLMIEVEKSSKKMRERRLLAIARDLNKNEVFHILFDFKKSKTLAIAAREAYNTLRMRKVKIEGILNLDVGSFNTLKVFDAGGQLVPKIQGTKEIDSATNLLIYYLKK